MQIPYLVTLFSQIRVRSPSHFQFNTQFSLNFYAIQRHRYLYSFHYRVLYRVAYQNGKNGMTRCLMGRGGLHPPVLCSVSLSRFQLFLAIGRNKSWNSCTYRIGVQHRQNYINTTIVPTSFTIPPQNRKTPRYWHPFVVDVQGTRTKPFSSTFLIRSAKAQNILPAFVFPAKCII